MYVPETWSNLWARGTEDDCVHIGGIGRIGRIVEEEWLHKQVEGLLSDPGRVWCDYHHTMTTIFECPFNPPIVGQTS